jgi:hypothetical protein
VPVPAAMVSAALLSLDVSFLDQQAISGEEAVCDWSRLQPDEPVPLILGLCPVWPVAMQRRPRSPATEDGRVYVIEVDVVDCGVATGVIGVAICDDPGVGTPACGVGVIAGGGGVGVGLPSTAG